jgi:ATP synthase protein I
MAEETPLQKRLRRRDEFEERGKQYRQMMKTHVGGMEVGLSVVVGALLGYWADRRFGTMPWGTLIGLALGCLTAGKVLYDISKKSLADAAREDAEAEAAAAAGKAEKESVA